MSQRVLYIFLCIAIALGFLPGCSDKQREADKEQPAIEKQETQKLQEEPTEDKAIEDQGKKEMEDQEKKEETPHIVPKEIKGKERVEEVVLTDNKTNKTKKIKVDGVFVAVGYSPVTELAKKIGVEITSDGYIKRDSKHRTNIPGVYSAGDVEGGYKQIVTAAGHGSEAALTVFEDIVNPYWKKEVQ